MLFIEICTQPACTSHIFHKNLKCLTPSSPPSPAESSRDSMDPASSLLTTGGQVWDNWQQGPVGPGQLAACSGAGSLVAALHVFQFLTRYMMGKYLLWFHMLLLFHSVYCVLWCSEVLALKQSMLPIFISVSCVYVFISRKSLPNAISWKFPAVFPSRSFIPLCVTFSSLIHFDLMFFYGVHF